MDAAAKPAAGRSASCDAMVTARVPREIKAQGDSILRELGSSPTKLVNAAYDFVVKNKRLPSDDGEAPAAPGTRTLTAAQRKELRSRLKRLNVGKIPSDAPFEELLDDAMRHRYGNVPGAQAVAGDGCGQADRGGERARAVGPAKGGRAAS